MKEIHNQAEFDSMFVTNLSALPQNEIIRIMPTKNGYNVNAPIVITKSNVIIQGYGKVRPKLKYVGASSVNNTGILHFAGTAGVELENIRVEYLDLDGVDKSKTNVSGIYCEYCGKAQTTGLAGGGYDSSTVGKDKVNKIGVTIKDCVVQGNNSYGIYLNRSSNSTVSENATQNNEYFGIRLYDSSNNCIITGNINQNNIGGGVQLYLASNCIVLKNQCNSCKNIGIHLFHSNNCTTVGNSVQNNSGYGIALDTSNNNTIAGNVCNNNVTTGITVDKSDSCTVTGNMVEIQNNNYAGIFTSGSSTIIEANTITQAAGVHIGSTGNYSLVLGNIMVGAGAGITMSGTGSKQVDNVKV